MNQWKATRYEFWHAQGKKVLAVEKNSGSGRWHAFRLSPHGWVLLNPGPGCRTKEAAMKVAERAKTETWSSSPPTLRRPATKSSRSTLPSQ